MTFGLRNLGALLSLCALCACGSSGSGSPNPHATLGPVRVDPPTAILTSVGASTGVAVSQSGYSGVFTESDTCAGIATLSSSSNNGGNATFTTTSVAPGGCNATFAGGGGKSGALTITVSLSGGLVVTPSQLVFTNIGGSAVQSLAVSQTGFTGTFTQSSTCAGIADVAPSFNQRGSATYVVTPIGGGVCKITFTGGGAATFLVSVSVTSTTFGINAEPRDLP